MTPAEAPAALAAPMLSGLFGASIEGIVRQSHGPLQGQHAANAWRTATLLLIFVGLLPLMLALLIVRIAFQIMLQMFFRSSGSAASSSFFGNLMSQGMSNLFGRQDEACAIHTYVIESAGRLLNARQEGDFIDGSIYPGNTVRLRGVWRGGTLVVRSGENLTLATRLTLAGNSWRSGFFVALLLLALLYAGLHAAGNSR